MDTHIIESQEFELKVHNFTKQLLNVEKSIRFEEFSIFCDFNESNWYFKIHARDSKLGIFLHMQGSEIDDFSIKCEVFVRKLNNAKMNSHQFLVPKEDFDSGYGWNNFISIEEVCNKSDQYLKNGTLSLVAKVQLIKKKESECTHVNEYQRACKELFITKSYNDFKIVCCDGTEIPAHRFILAAFSPIMKRMIDIEMIESKNSTVIIKDIDGETMTEILRFIYTQEIENIDEFAVKLLYGAEKYELTKLKKLCVASMIKNLSTENALDYFIMADQYNIKVLLLHSALFIKSHYDILRKKDWNKFCRNHFVTLLDNYQQNPEGVKVFESTF